MAELEENKALDLGGLSRFYDDLCAYGIGDIAKKDSTSHGVVEYNNQITSDPNNHSLDVDETTTLSLGNTLLHSGGMKLGVKNWTASGQPTLTLDESSLTFANGNGPTATLTPPSNWAGGSIATETYVNNKTWSATDITSGVLSISRGGTGRSSSPSMLVNLASTTAGSPLIASPRPGVTGILPASHGGTGVSNLKDLIKFTYTSSTKTLNITVDTSLFGD